MSQKCDKKFQYCSALSGNGKLNLLHYFKLGVSGGI